MSQIENEYRQIQDELCRWAATVREFDILEIPPLDQYSAPLRAMVITDLIFAGWFRAQRECEKTHQYVPSRRLPMMRSGATGDEDENESEDRGLICMKNGLAKTG